MKSIGPGSIGPRPKAQFEPPAGVGPRAQKAPGPKRGPGPIVLIFILVLDYSWVAGQNIRGVDWTPELFPKQL